MKINFYLLFVPLFILFQNNSIAQKSSSFKDDYMPLAVGNKWIYNFPNSSIFETVIEVVAIDTIERKEYYIIKNSNISSDTTRAYYTYKRISNDTLYSLIYSNSYQRYIELVDAIFSMNLNDIAWIDIDIKPDASDENNSIMLSARDSAKIFDIDGVNTENNSIKSLPIPTIKHYSIRVINKNDTTIEFHTKYGGLDNEANRIYRKGVGLIPTKGKLLKYELE